MAPRTRRQAAADAAELRYEKLEKIRESCASLRLQMLSSQSCTNEFTRELIRELTDAQHLAEIRTDDRHTYEQLTAALKSQFESVDASAGKLAEAAKVSDSSIPETLEFAMHATALVFFALDDISKL